MKLIKTEIKEIVQKAEVKVYALSDEEKAVITALRAKHWFIELDHNAWRNGKPATDLEAWELKPSYRSTVQFYVHSPRTHNPYWLNMDMEVESITDEFFKRKEAEHLWEEWMKSNLTSDECDLAEHCEIVRAIGAKVTEWLITNEKADLYVILGIIKQAIENVEVL